MDTYFSPRGRDERTPSPLLRLRPRHEIHPCDTFTLTPHSHTTTEQAPESKWNTAIAQPEVTTPRRTLQGTPSRHLRLANTNLKRRAMDANPEVRREALNHTPAPRWHAYPDKHHRVAQWKDPTASKSRRLRSHPNHLHTHTTHRPNSKVLLKNVAHLLREIALDGVQFGIGPDF